MIFRYLLVGGTAAATDIVIFVFFSYLLGFNYLVVGALGFMIATAVNYILSIRFVFESGVRFKKRAELSAIYFVSGIGLLVHELILYALVDILQIFLVFAKVVATGSVFFWNYGARKYYVFRIAK